MESAFCPHCHKFYEDPRILACLHSVCFLCIKSLYRKETSSIICPNCSHQTTVPSGGNPEELAPKNTKLIRVVKLEKLLSEITVVPPSICGSCEEFIPVSYCTNCSYFLCTECLAAHQRLKTSRSHSSFTLTEAKKMTQEKLVGMLSSSSKPQPSLCQYHNQKRDMYCEHCDVPVCALCLELVHKGHDVRQCKREVMESKQEIQQSVVNMQINLKKIENELGNGEETKKKLQVQRNGTVDKLKQAFSKLHSIISKREEELITQCTVLAAERDASLMVQLESMGTLAERFKTSILFALNVGEEYLDDEVVCISKLVAERSSFLRSQMNQDVSNGSSSLVEVNTEEVSEMLSKLGSLSKVPPCRDLGCSLRYEAHVVTGMEGKSGFQSSGGLNFQLGKGETSFTGRGLALTSTPAQVSTNDTYITTVPQAAVNSSSLCLKKPHFLLKQPPTNVHSNYSTAVTRIHGINHPKSLAFSDVGDIFVTSNDDHVSVFRKTTVHEYKWEKIGSKGTGELQFLTPCGIAVAGKVVYVTESEGNRVHMFTTSGKFVGVFGQEGSYTEIFNSPGDIKISPDWKIYIADTGNYRVKIFNKDWTISHVIQSSNGYGNYSKPCGIAFDPSGHVHIAWEGSTSPVKVYNSNGEYLCGYGEIVNSAISGIAIDQHGYSLVICYNTCLDVFSPDRTKKCSIHLFNCPHGVAVTPNGNVWVADTNNRRLAVLQS